LPWAKRAAAYRERGASSSARHGKRASSWRRIIMATLQFKESNILFRFLGVYSPAHFLQMGFHGESVLRQAGQNFFPHWLHVCSILASLPQISHLAIGFTPLTP
jgi:hypothetical protein